MTWAFLPIELQQNPQAQRLLIHELESLFWILVYSVIHFCKQRTLPSWFRAEDIFAEKIVTVSRDGAKISGGRSKLEMLRTEQLHALTLTCKPLQDLVNLLAD